METYSGAPRRNSAVVNAQGGTLLVWTLRQTEGCGASAGMRHLS